MINLKTLGFGILLGLILGAGGWHWIFAPATINDQDKKNLDANQDSVSCQQLKNKILDLQQEISAKMQNDSSVLEDANKRLALTQDLYSKMFNMFLANVALNLKDKSKWQVLKETNDLVAQSSDSACDKVNASANDNKRAETPEMNGERPNRPSEPRATSTPEKEEKKSSALLLQGERLAKPSRYYRKSIPIVGKNTLFESLQGRFKGKIHHKNENKIWDMVVFADYTFNGKIYQGEAFVELSDDIRGVFSNSRSHGDNNNFQSNSDDPEALVLEASPDSFARLQPIYNASKKITGLKGSYYQVKKKSKEYKYLGSILLYRE